MQAWRRAVPTRRTRSFVTGVRSVGMREATRTVVSPTLPAHGRLRRDDDAGRPFDRGREAVDIIHHRSPPWTSGRGAWVRRQPVGDALVVVARDPAAREDLPSLARLLGHQVTSVATDDDGLLELTVKRGR
jgi:hypothetical protein